MNEFTTLRINRAEPDVLDLGDWLRIEQPEWPEASGAGFAAWLVTEGKGLSIASYAEYYSQYNSHCEGDGSLTVEIQIHRSRPDLPYAASASYGELSEKYIHQASFKQSRTVSRAKSIDLEVEVVGIVSAAWEGPLFGIDGVEISPPPPITVAGSELSWGVELSGVLRLDYTEEHDAYTLTITPREAGDFEADDPEGAYQSTVFAVWAGGVESHDVDLPDMDGYCGGGSRVIINPDDPDDGKCVRHHILVDPCDGSVIKEWDEQISCPGDGT